MRVQCPTCSKSFKVEDQHLGKKGKCPNCKSSFVIEGMQEVPPPLSQRADNRKPEFGNGWPTLVPNSAKKATLPNRNWLYLVTVAGGFVVLVASAYCIGLMSMPSNVKTSNQQALKEPDPVAAQNEDRPTAEEVVQVEQQAALQEAKKAVDDAAKEQKSHVAELAQRTHMTFRSIDKRESNGAAMLALDEWKSFTRTLHPVAANDEFVIRWIKVTSQDFDKAMKLLNTESKVKAERAEFRSRADDLLKNIPVATDLLAEHFGLSSDEAHGSHLFRKQLVAFLKSSHEFIDTFQDCKASDAKEETAKKMKSMESELLKLYIAIPKPPQFTRDEKDISHEDLPHNIRFSAHLVVLSFEGVISGMSDIADPDGIRNRYGFRELIRREEVLNQATQMYYDNQRLLSQYVGICEESLKLQDARARRLEISFE